MEIPQHHQPDPIPEMSGGLHECATIAAGWAERNRREPLAVHILAHWKSYADSDFQNRGYAEEIVDTLWPGIEWER